MTVDVRLVAATNRDLEAAVRSGTFRNDLYHRISEVQIRVPPLRERPQDIVALAEHFLAQRRPESRFTGEARELLMRSEWPGNVRELRNLVIQLGILTSHQDITADDIRLHWRDNHDIDNLSATLTPRGVATLNEMERLMILRTLEATNGNQSLAAHQSGIPRRTFCRKLNEHHITLGRRDNSRPEPPSPLSGSCRQK